MPGDASTDVGSAAPTIVDANGKPAAAPPTHTTSPVPLIAGGALVLVLAAGAAVATYRRRGLAE